MEVCARPINTSDADSLFIASKRFEAAFDRTTVELAASGVRYETMPLLYTREKAFDKRFMDRLTGKKESINLPSKLKQFVRSQLPDYSFHEKYTFRKPLNSGVDGILQFEPVNHMGLGKSFTIRYAIDSPLIAAYRGQDHYSYFCYNIFKLFRKTWDGPCWVYTSGDELQEVFAACKFLLARTLPILEKALIELFSSPSSSLPSELRTRGALSARQAYDIALPLAQSWAGSEHFELISIAAAPDLSVRDFLGPGIDHDGRLEKHGSWGIHFRCPSTQTRTTVTIPYLGEIHQMSLQTSMVGWGVGTRGQRTEVLPPIEIDWLDSPVIAAAFETLRQEHTGKGTYRTFMLGYTLHVWGRETPTWKIDLCTIKADEDDGKRDDLTVFFCAFTGEILEVRQLR